MKELDLLIKNIKNKALLPIYFFHGPEPYYIDQVVNVLENDYLEEDEKAFNQTVVYGKDTTYQEILALARQYPMMGDKMLIIVKEAQDLRLTSEEAAILLQYVLEPVESTILVFAHKGKKIDGKQKKLVAALKNYLFFSDSVKEWDLVKVIQGEISRLKLKTAPNIANLLAEYLGNDLSRVINELEKVKIVLKEGEILDEKLVERYIGISKEYNVFELQKAIVAKDMASAMKIATVMGKNEKDYSVIKINGILFSYFYKLILYHTVKDQPKESVAAELGISPFLVKDYHAAAQLYPLKYATRVVTILREMDLKSKGLGVQGTPDRELLIEMVYKIINIDKTKVKI